MARRERKELPWSPHYFWPPHFFAEEMMIVSRESGYAMSKGAIAACWRGQGKGIHYLTALPDDILVKDYKVHKRNIGDREDLGVKSQSVEETVESFSLAFSSNSKNGKKIDHHPSPDEHRAYPEVEEKKASTLTCQIDDDIFKADNDPTMATSYLLAVMNRRTKVTRLVPFQDIFPRLQWTAPSVSPSKQGTAPPEDKIPSSSYTTPTIPRLSVFSGAPKRRKKSDKKEESFLVSDLVHDAAGMVAFNSNEEDVNLNALMILPQDASLNLTIGEDIRPSPNLETKFAQDLYNWDEVVPPDTVIAAFFPMADTLIGSKSIDHQIWKRTNRFSLFFMAVLEKSLRSKKYSLDDLGLRIANFLSIHYLCHLFDLKDRPMRPREMLPEEVPPVAAKYLIEEFTEVSEFSDKKRIVTEKCKDKLMARVLLLILFVEKYSADITMLIAPLNDRDRRRVQNVATICGGKYTERRTKSVWTYTLTLKYPWQFPKVSTGNSPSKKRKRL